MPLEQTSVSGETDRIRLRAFGRLRNTLPGFEPADCLRFYKAHNLDALRLLDALLRNGGQDAQDVARRLARRFLELGQVRDENPDEYERLLRIDRMEAESWLLAHRVRTLRRMLRNSRVDKTAGEAELDRARSKLKELLPRVFSAKQQSHLIEVNRLEAEVRELRGLLQQREVNRDEIVRLHYAEITGEDSGARVLPLRRGSEGVAASDDEALRW